MAVDEHDPFANPLDVRDRVGGEAGGRDEDAFGRTSTVEASSEHLKFWSADILVPALGLDVYGVQPEFVFLDDSINAFVAGPADRLSSVGPRSSVSHRDKQFDDEALEEAWWGGLDAIEQLLG